MKPFKSLIVLALVLSPAMSFAQGYYGGGAPPPEPGGFHRRAGRLAWGFSIGLGYMNANGSRIACSGCDNQPITGTVDGHIGGMVNNRLAILFELQSNFQRVGYTGYSDTTLNQDLLMGAAQYWLTPTLWIKGGIGFAHVQLVDNGFGASIYDPQSDGLALMAGIGFELMSARYFALDLQGRISEGSYVHSDNSQDHITSGTVGLGFNWY